MSISTLPNNRSISSARDVEERPGPSKSEVMLDDMRLDLITGQLAPDARVKIHELTERYSVSRTIAREVLPKLAAEGLLIGMA